MFRHLDRCLAHSADGALAFGDTAAFEFEGQRIVMRQVQGQGIHKPKQLSAALSITTAYSSSESAQPYADAMGADGYQRYKYQGSDPNIAANRALRASFVHKLPLAYFVGVAHARYRPVYPVYVIADAPGDLEVALGFQASEVGLDLGAMSSIDKVYAARETKQRLHQPRFREQVLLAYRKSCAICSLRHPELLDAAHIIGDSEPNGDPIVPNGLSLCKIHHAAYDNQLLGIRPDAVVEINHQLLDEVDGPMLRHGLQEMHGRLLFLPARVAHRPDPDRLEVRYRRFLEAG